MHTLDKEILRLALPSILANITIPLVGMVGTAVAGHLPVSGAAGAAVFIGAISVGSMLFNLLYWNFSFLRTGTGGLTAQAYGAGDMHACAGILYRGVGLALACALLALALQWPFVKLALLIVDASPEVEALAAKYFFIRIWAAPATIGLMAFSGWFVGMQDSVSSMWKDLVVNIVNMAASLILALGIGKWDGLGFIGIPVATVAAQYSGLLFCILVCVFKYRTKVFSHFSLKELPGLMDRSSMRSYMKMNADLFGRSIGFTVIYIGYTLIAAGYGDTMLACSAIMMQLLMLFSYFTDGFAYAGEALTGRFVGARDATMMRLTVRKVFVWSMSIAVAFIGIYWACGVPLLRLLTSDVTVVESCRQFLPWLILMPPLGCAAFTWDGIYLGATASRPIRNSMLGAALCFFLFWMVSTLIRGGAPSGAEVPEALERYNALGIHLLLGAYFAHLLFRTVYMSLKYRSSVTVRHL